MLLLRRQDCQLTWLDLAMSTTGVYWRANKVLFYCVPLQSDARSRETPIVSCKDGDTEPDDKTALGCVLGLIEQLKKGVD